MDKQIKLKVDHAGRVIIPKIIRKKFDIIPNDKLILTTNEKGIILIKEKEFDKYKILKNKLEYLKELLNIEYLVIKNNLIIDTDKSLNKYLNLNVNINIDKKGEILFNKSLKLNEIIIKKNHFYFVYKYDSYNLYYVYIFIDNKNKEKVLSYLKMLV